MPSGWSRAILHEFLVNPIHSPSGDRSGACASALPVVTSLRSLPSGSTRIDLPLLPWPPSTWKAINPFSPGSVACAG